MSVALCACMKNEGPYILEWVAYHRMLGFREIFIYDNSSTDQTPTILSRLAAAGFIRHIPWPDETLRVDPENPLEGPQAPAYNDCLKRVESDWIAYIDADEFINLKQDETIDAFIDRFGSDVGMVSLNWRIFGSSGRHEAGEGLVMERFRRASVEGFSANANVKSISRVADVLRAHVHICSIRRGRAVNDVGTTIPVFEHGGKVASTSHSVAQVNHYVLKSREEFEEKKRRGDATLSVKSPLKYGKMTEEFFSSHDANDELDESILRRLGNTKFALRELESICEDGVKF